MFTYKQKYDIIWLTTAFTGKNVSIWIRLGMEKENKNLETPENDILPGCLLDKLLEEYKEQFFSSNKSPSPFAENFWYWAGEEYDRLEEIKKNQEDFGGLPLYSNEPASPGMENFWYWAREEYDRLVIEKRKQRIRNFFR